MAVGDLLVQLQDNYAALSEWFEEKSTGKLSAGARIELYTQLRDFMNDGLDPIRALEKLTYIYENNWRTRSRARLYQRWIGRVREGLSLPDAMADNITDMDRVILTAGESSGDLGRGFERARQLNAVAREVASTIVLGSIYPVLMFFGLLGLMAFLGTFLVPTVAGLLEGDLPTGLVIIEAVGSFVVGWFLPLIIGGVALSALVAVSLSRWGNALRYQVFDLLPPWSVYRVYQSAVFLAALAAMMGAGIALVPALQQISSLGTRWLKNQVEEIVDRVRDGLPDGEAMAIGMFRGQANILLRVYSESSAFDEVIDNLSHRIIERILARARTLTKVVGFSLTIAVGGTVVFVVLSLFSAVGSLDGAAGM